MSRRPVNPSRRLVDGGSLPFVGVIQSKSRSSPLLTIGLVVVLLFANILIISLRTYKKKHISSVEVPFICGGGLGRGCRGVK